MNSFNLEEQGQNAKLSAELLLEELRVLIKEEFIAVVRKKGDELELRFPNGERYSLTIWKNTKNT